MTRNIPTTLTQPLFWLACVLICGYFFAHFIFLVLANYFPGPYYDYWVDIAKVEKFFDDFSSLTLGEMLSAHNDAHRLFLPRILFILDYVIASGSNAFLISVSITCKIATLALFNRSISTASIRDKLVLNAVFFAGIFSVGNLSNIMMSSNIQWDLMLLFSVSSLYFFKQDSLAGGRWHFGLFFLVLSFLSHAGSLVIPLTFLCFSFFGRQTKNTLLSIACLLAIVLLHFYLVPLLTGENSGSSSDPSDNLSVESVLIWLILWVNFILHAIFAPVRHLGSIGFYFSLFFLVLFYRIMRRCYQQPEKTHYFDLCSLFLFLVTLLIAAGRVNTNPNFYWASQYEPIVILWGVSVTAATFIQTPLSTGGWWRWITIAHFLFMMIWNQLQPYPYGFVRSNRALDSHTYMFMFDRDQYQGDALKIWVMDPDPVKAIDPFFEKNHFAYYHNKQGGEGAYRRFIQPGESFVTEQEWNTFTQGCALNTAAIQYKAGKFGKYNFSTPINLSQTFYLKASWRRNSYYVLDKSGKVSGYAFIFMPPKSLWPLPVLQGLLNTTDAAYIAEVIEGRPSCRYTLTSP